MTDATDLRAVFRDGPAHSSDPRIEKRHRRADATRAQALSPVRILTSVLLVPVVAGGLTVSIYIRTSPFEREDALRHLIAMSSCSAAEKFGVAGAKRGDPGYHARFDTNGDGIACREDLVALAPAPADPPALDRGVSGAKFIRP